MTYSTSTSTTRNWPARPSIIPDGGHGAYGWCNVQKVWKTGQEMYREINICAEYLDRPMTEVCATILHEMTHLHNLLHEVEDTSNNGYYHNMKFKATAEDHGLRIEKHQKYGWTITTLAPKAEIWVKKALGDEAINASRLPEGSAGKEKGKKSKNRSIKYVCPECGPSSGVNVICGDCDVPFEQE